MNVPARTQTEERAQRTLTREDYERYLPLVRRIAMRLARRVPSHIAVDDLVSCGWIGLMEAFRRAVPSMPHEEFEAYASYRVRGAMLDFLRSFDPMAREMRNASRRLTRAIARLTSTLGRAPEENEIAAALGIGQEEYRSMLTAVDMAGMARLEILHFDQESIESDSPMADDEASRKELNSAVVTAIGTLPPRLQKVLALYYQEECTLREVGAVLGVSESRVSQLHTEAMHRLRAAVGSE